MWQLLMAILGNMAKAAAKGGSAIGKGALELGKKSVRASQMGKLAEAFGGSLDNLKKPQVTATPELVVQPSIQTPQALPTIPQNIPQSIMPQGNVGIGGQAPRPTIPPQYMNLANAPQFSGNINQGMPGTLPQATQGAPRGLAGFMQEFGHSLIGKPPSEGEGTGWERYAARFIPDVIRSKLGVDTAQEARTRERLNTYYDALGKTESGPNIRYFDATGKEVPPGTPGAFPMKGTPNKGGGLNWTSITTERPSQEISAMKLNILKDLQSGTRSMGDLEDWELTLIKPDLMTLMVGQNSSSTGNKPWYLNK